MPVTLTSEISCTSFAASLVPLARSQISSDCERLS
ncbi:hypothetical protein OG2516_18475 [Oceanicola granulosus HTCC2516]|uniref:Uncharacterized protein n=1 Tax=Oceanicola granulosus (strain ATCC BAA-861 / DSM 15982 / KCTC 12143 / HTCC2516) TaxID=314256 RepID=Q2CHG1_OCEGH|nr:hypothetical protein OG2516_18475 [Oceanicola granulosus HTCC2516]